MKGTTRQSDVTIGLDLGDRRCEACVLDAAGEVVERRSVATTKVAMEGVFDEYVGCLVVMEVGTHSPWVSRLFKTRGFKVITANPRQVRLITECIFRRCRSLIPGDGDRQRAMAVGARRRTACDRHGGRRGRVPCG